MQSPAFPENESERLQALYRCLLLDTMPEDRFDRLTRLARQMLGTQIALVSLVDAQRQWFKSCQGLDASETGRDISFCGHAILGTDIFQVVDARLDSRFADNPLVTGAPCIRFYAGAPLSTADGYMIGTLCIIDDKPRELTKQELQALRDLADCVEDEIGRIDLQQQKSALNQFKNTLDRTLDCVFMFDAKTLCFFYANQGALLQVGYDMGELKDMHPYDIKPEISKEKFHEIIAPMLAGEQMSITFETLHQHKSGQRVPVEVFLQYIASEGEQARFVAIVRDINERKSAGEKLRKTTLLLESIFENVPNMIFLKRASDLRFEYFNRAGEALLGHRRSDLLGRNDYDFFPKEQADFFTGKDRSVLEQYAVVDIPEETVDTPRGQRILHTQKLALRDDEGVPQYLLGISEDITERKLAESALLEQAQHTQAILDNMIDGIITIDLTGSIHSFTPAAERIFGYITEEVLGQNIRILMPNPYRDAHDGYLRNYQATGVARIIGIGREVEGRRKDGSLFPMDLAISEITRQGKAMYVGIVRDITERKKMDRMKSEFVSTVSHELRTPLTSISGALGLIVGGTFGELPAQAQKMITIAHKNSQRLTLLINDLLDMEKIAAGKMTFDMQPQPLMPLIEQALEAHRAYGAERRVTLALLGRIAGADVRIDSQRLMQVLSNLLSNAIKFTPENGAVEIAVELCDSFVRVTVTDHGPGIPAEFRSRIFQKFSQADSSDTRQKGGTGLGLAISRELMERMGGRIGFDSVEGQGASFYFELPLME